MPLKRTILHGGIRLLLICCAWACSSAWDTDISHVCCRCCCFAALCMLHRQAQAEVACCAQLVTFSSCSTMGCGEESHVSLPTCCATTALGKGGMSVAALQPSAGRLLCLLVSKVTDGWVGEWVNGAAWAACGMGCQCVNLGNTSGTCGRIVRYGLNAGACRQGVVCLHMST